jgi:hypothetical protein
MKTILATDLRKQGFKRCSCHLHEGGRVLPLSEFRGLSRLNSRCSRCDNRLACRRRSEQEKVARYLAWAMDFRRQEIAYRKYIGNNRPYREGRAEKRRRLQGRGGTLAGNPAATAIVG